MTMWKKQILARAIRIQKENRGVTVHFSDIIELKLGKEIAIHFLSFDAFLELWLLSYLSKMRSYPHFSFSIPIILAKIYFSP